MLATFAFIRAGQVDVAIEIADLLLRHRHDLIHKAVGWMLREVGKVDLPAELQFLAPRYRQMPRTMLRYAIERFDPELRRAYLDGVAWPPAPGGRRHLVGQRHPAVIWVYSPLI